MQEEKWRQEKKQTIQSTLQELQRRHQELLGIQDKVQQTNHNMHEDKKVQEEKYKELQEKQ